MPEHPWFEIEEPEGPDDRDDVIEFSATERAFLAALRERTAPWASGDVDGMVGRPDDSNTLMAGLSLTDSNSVLVDFGVHFRGNRVRGDRLHSQLFMLPERPSNWALDATGTVQELAQQSASWFQSVLCKPVVLYVWLYDGQADE